MLVTKDNSNISVKMSNVQDGVEGESEDDFAFYADEIIPGLYLGSALAANDLEGMRKCGIQHVLVPAKLGLERKPFRKEFNYLVWDVQDVLDYPIIWAFPSFVQYIKEALGRGEKVLVHCQAGRSRSPSVVCAYLMAEGFCKADVSQARGCYEMIRKQRLQVKERKFIAQVELWGRLKYRLIDPKEFDAFFSGSVGKAEKGSSEVVDNDRELLRGKFSIESIKPMKEAFLGNVPTFFPKITDT